jgi:hypothetical protein
MSNGNHLPDLSNDTDTRKDHPGLLFHSSPSSRSMTNFIDGISVEGERISVCKAFGELHTFLDTLPNDMAQSQEPLSSDASPMSPFGHSAVYSEYKKTRRPHRSERIPRLPIRSPSCDIRPRCVFYIHPKSIHLLTDCPSTPLELKRDEPMAVPVIYYGPPNSFWGFYPSIGVVPSAPKAARSRRSTKSLSGSPDRSYAPIRGRAFADQPANL